MTGHQLDRDLTSRLCERFAERVMQAASLPATRLDDLRNSCDFTLTERPSLLRLTCRVTGSTYETDWDGNETTALALTDEAADDTADLVTTTRHYAWIRSGR